MKTIEFVMSQDEFWRGIRGDCSGCPVALCIMRTIPALGHVEVSNTSIEFYKHTENFPFYVSPVSDSLNEFIAAFDFGDAPGPITFTLDIPDEVLAWAA